MKQKIKNIVIAKKSFQTHDIDKNEFVQIIKNRTKGIYYQYSNCIIIELKNKKRRLEYDDIKSMKKDFNYLN